MAIIKKFHEFSAACRLLGLRLSVAINILCLELLSVFFEGLGVGMVLPVLEFMQLEGQIDTLVQTSGLWKALDSVYSVLGLNISLPLLLGTALLFMIISVSVVYWRNVYSNVARFNAIRIARDEAFREYLGTRLSYGERERVGEIINDFTIELERAVSCLFESLRLTGAAILILTYFVLALLVSVPMTLTVIPIAIIAFLAVRGFMKKSHHAGEVVTKANQGLVDFLTERLKSVRLIRLSGTTQIEVKDLQEHSARQFYGHTLGQVLATRLSSVVEIISAATTIGFLYLGFAVFDLSIAEIGLFVAAMLRLMPRVREFLQSRQRLLSFSVALATVIKRIESMRFEAEIDIDGSTFSPLRKEIYLEDVNFKYDGSHLAALHGINIIIPAKKMSAVVGPSGAGKSTLVDLLPRIRDRESGDILFDGKSIDTFSLSSLRNQFAYAPQTPQIFNNTISSHIKYGTPDATNAEIESAARLAGAHDFIKSLPLGYDSNTGADGVKLSGGQRQRLDLARALVSRSSILILDEPTSNLDAESEEAFRDALSRISKNTDITIIVIGHQLSTTVVADQIIVIESGRVTDVGNHSELMQRGGWYASAFKSQIGQTSTFNEIE